MMFMIKNDTKKEIVSPKIKEIDLVADCTSFKTKRIFKVDQWKINPFLVNPIFGIFVIEDATDEPYAVVKGITAWNPTDHSLTSITLQGMGATKNQT